jgi:competence protein ComGF
MMMLETLLALMLVVNILLLIALMAFCYKLNKDWAEFFTKVNMEWAAFAGLLMGAFDDVEEEEIWD